MKFDLSKDSVTCGCFNFPIKIFQAPASGWGKPTDSADSISPVLREVTTKTITNLVCVFELFQITKNNICISGAGGKSTCNVINFLQLT